eukprot:scaffold952_cov409-Prasinococcus_capsulatus_cf.AAC.49
MPRATTTTARGRARGPGRRGAAASERPPEAQVGAKTAPEWPRTGPIAGGAGHRHDGLYLYTKPPKRTQYGLLSTLTPTPPSRHIGYDPVSNGEAQMEIFECLDNF